MAGQMNTYAEFAENDYKFFRQSYDSGNKGSALAALGQTLNVPIRKMNLKRYPRKAFYGHIV